MNSVLQEHCYEELRDVVIAILLDGGDNGAHRFEKVLERTAVDLCRMDGQDPGGRPVPLHRNDGELVLEIVWDLFRQGIVTFGLNASSPGWPWLRLSRFGEGALRRGPVRLHSKAAFMMALQSDAIDISTDAIVYLREAVAAFDADCLLAACVTLGLAAETEFLRLLEAANASRTYGRHFARIGDGAPIRAKVLRFGEAIKPILPLLPEPATSELGAALITVQSILRTARNESGQPSGASAPSRDQVYVYLQLFIPLAEQLTRLRREMAAADYPRLVVAPMALKRSLSQV